MHKNITFMVTTQHDHGKAVNIQLSNSHVSSWTHAARLAKRRAGRPRVSKALHFKVGSFSDARGGPDTVVAKDKKSDRASRLLESDQHIVVMVDQPLNLPSDLLSSSLDPFLHVPVKITRYETSLLQFYMVDGIRLCFGVYPSPSYNPPVIMASQMLENSPLWIYSHVVIAEEILHHLGKRPRSRSFYLRQAHTYKAMNDLLDSPSATLYEKLVGFIQVYALEMILGRHHLRAQHSQAMNQWIEDHGGLSHLLPKRRDYEQTQILAFFSALYINSGVTISSQSAFQAVKQRFADGLQDINRWYSHIRNEICNRNHHSAGSFECATVEHKLADLRTYLDWLIGPCLEKHDTPPFTMAGAFHFLFNLCIAQAKYEYNGEESLHFLMHIARIMSESVVSIDISQGGRLWKVEPASMAVIMGYGRCKIRLSPRKTDIDEEVQICEASTDAMKLLPLLPWATRLRLARDCTKCSLQVLDSVDTKNEVIFDDRYIDEVLRDIDHGWDRKK